MLSFAQTHNYRVLILVCIFFKGRIGVRGGIFNQFYVLLSTFTSLLLEVEETIEDRITIENLTREEMRALSIYHLKKQGLCIDT